MGFSFVLVTNKGTVLVTNVGTVVGFKQSFVEVKIHGGLRNLFLVKKPLRTKKGKSEVKELGCKKFMADS